MSVQDSHIPIAILPVGSTSLDKYSWGENMPFKLKELNWLFLRNLSELRDPSFACALFILKCFTYKRLIQHMLRLDRQIWVSPRFKMATFLIRAIWFVRIYAILNSNRKNDCYELWDFLLCEWCCLHSRCLSFPIIHPTSCNRGYLTPSPQ